MGITEVREFSWKCDYCGKKVRVKSSNAPPPPRGWKRRYQHGCGMTGYTRDNIACGSCAKKVPEHS